MVNGDTALARVSAAVEGRVPTVVGIGATARGRRSIAVSPAQAAGGDILMVTSPGMAAIAPAQVRAHYEAVARTIGLPITFRRARADRHLDDERAAH
ncbi:MAG: hypothetical protein R2843_06400 [Thermomicrobiales bacterium]